MKRKNLILSLALTAMLPLAGCGDEPDPIVEEIAVESITLSKTSVTLRVTGKETLTATVTPDNASDKTVTWSVAPAGIATVKDGVVTAVAVGECVVTATAGGKSATCNVVVSPEPAIDVTSVAISEDSVELELDATKQLTATVLPEDATDPSVTWTSSNAEYVSVSATGLLTAKKVTTEAVKITATAGTKTDECYVSVKDHPVNFYYAISEANINRNIATYLDNVKGTHPKYLGTVERLTVGTDNSFQMKPELKVIDLQTAKQADPAVWNLPFEGKIEELDAEAFVAAKDTYGEFDATNCSFKFNEKAIGKTLRLSVNPTGLIDGQNVADYTNSVEVNVTAGYNVYTDVELAYFNDTAATSRWYCSKEGTQGITVEAQNNAWKKFRREHNMSETYVPANVLLQANISLTASSIPNEFLIQSGEKGDVGFLRDTMDIYFRQNSDFVFNGNYFNIDATNLPTAGDLLSDWDGISHSTLFKCYESRSDKDASYVFKNCSYFGNSPRANNTAGTHYEAGLIFFKFTTEPTYGRYPHAVFDNFNVEKACISFFMDSCHAKVDVKNSVVKEGYSNAIFMFHNGDLFIDNCKFNNFGGPVIVSRTDGNNGVTYCPTVKVSTNSVLESWCSGQEPWFANVGASGLIENVTQPNAFFTPFGKSFLKNEEGTDFFNAIYVGQSPEGSRYGSIQFGDTSVLGLNYSSSVTDITKVAIADAIQASSGQSLVVQTSAGGFAYGFAHAAYKSGAQCLTDFIPNNPLNAEAEIGAAIMGGTFPDLSVPEAYQNAIYQGDYINLFTNAGALGTLTLVFNYLTITQ